MRQCWLFLSIFQAKANNTCQSDNLFRGAFFAGRYASKKRHCTLRYTSLKVNLYMKSVMFISFMLALIVGFVIGSIIGVQVVEVSAVSIPKDTMYTFIFNNLGLLGSVSSFLALVFAILLFVGWKKQQKDLLVIDHHKKLLENIAKLGSTFRLHILSGAMNKKESVIFYNDLYSQLINISELITVHYILSETKKNGSKYIDRFVANQNDFLDPVKDYYLFINNYYFLSNCASIDFDSEKKRIGYLSLDNEIAKDIFKDAEKESNYTYINIGEYNARVSSIFDLAVNAIKNELV